MPSTLLTRKGRIRFRQIIPAATKNTEEKVWKVCTENIVPSEMRAGYERNREWIMAWGDTHASATRDYLSKRSEGRRYRGAGARESGAAKLEQVCDYMVRLPGCHRNAPPERENGCPYRVRIAMTVPPGQELVVTRDAGKGLLSGETRREKKRSDNRGVSRGNIRDFPLKIEGSPNSHERGHSV